MFKKNTFNDFRLFERLARHRDRAKGGLPGQLPHHAMPNYVGFSVPAGWVGLFDSSSWHTSMPVRKAPSPFGCQGKES